MPAEWLYERGIGEARAALVEDARIVEARIERDDAGPRPGAVLAARLGPRGTNDRAEVRLDGGGIAWLRPVPPALSEGATMLVEISRAALPEPGNPKPPHARPAPAGAVPRPAPDLLARIDASDLPVRRLHAHQPDALEQHGWSEVLHEAASGLIPFAGGLLRLSLTPAMSLFDVDGHLPAEALAIAGARAAGAAIRRLAIGGSIGVDLPALQSKAARQDVATAFDASLPQPFERTAVNGFGFLQIVRRREAVSLPELLQSDPALAAALALLRQAERAGGRGTRTLAAAPAVFARLRPEWRDALARRIGAAVALRELPGAAISAGHVESEFP